MSRRARTEFEGVPHHVTQRGNGRARTEPLMSRYPDFAAGVAAKVAAGEDEALSLHLRRAETIGRPVGDAAFIAQLEARSGRASSPARRGPKPKTVLSALSP